MYHMPNWKKVYAKISGSVLRVAQTPADYPSMALTVGKLSKTVGELPLTEGELDMTPFGRHC
jgi:hypothetical protein